MQENAYMGRPTDRQPRTDRTSARANQAHENKQQTYDEEQ